MCLRITAPFLVSTNPLSLLCRGRLLVCSISSLLSSLATLWLMNSLPLIGVEAADAKRKLPQQGGQHRLQPGFADAGSRRHDLPLRDLVDGVDVIHAFGARLIALVH